MEWISVKDRLPDKQKQVLVYDHGKGIITQGFKYQHSNVWHVTTYMDSINIFTGEVAINVTHWMPLPDEPKD